MANETNGDLGMLDWTKFVSVGSNIKGSVDSPGRSRTVVKNEVEIHGYVKKLRRGLGFSKVKLEQRVDVVLRPLPVGIEEELEWASVAFAK